MEISSLNEGRAGDPSIFVRKPLSIVTEVKIPFSVVTSVKLMSFTLKLISRLLPVSEVI